MERFEDLVGKRDGQRENHRRAREAMQAEYEAACEQAYKRLFPRRKFSMARGQKENKDEQAAIFERFSVRANEMTETHKQETEATETALCEAAESATFPAFDGMSLYYVSWGMAYSSQAYGAGKYARAAAETEADKARAHGLTVVVRERPDPRPANAGSYWTPAPDFEVWVNTSSLGAEILRYKPCCEDIVEWAARCWKRGTNPKVYNPFLSQEVCDEALKMSQKEGFAVEE